MIVDPSIPQPQPLPSQGVAPGIMSSQDIVDHLDKVLAMQPKPVQDAVEHAHGALGLNSPADAAANGPSAPPVPSENGSGVDTSLLSGNASGVDSPIVPAGSPNDPQPLSTPKMSRVPMEDGFAARSSSNALPSGVGISPSGGTAIAPASALDAKPIDPHMAELERLHSTGSGVSQIKNPFLRTLATIGDVIGSGLEPGLAQFIPGTSAHHEQLIGQEENQLGQEQKATKATDESRLQNAKSTEAESLPDLHKTQAELVAEKLHSTETAKDADRAIKQSEEDRKTQQGQAAIDQHLAASGLKRDESGNIVPQEYKEMSEPLQAIHDLKSSQQELADSRAALVKAQKDNLPAAQKLAQQRIDNATHASAVAEQRLGLAEKNYELRVGGGSEADAHPGQLLDDNDKTIGTAFQGNVKPTGTERTKGEMANSAAEQLGDIKAIIHKRPDIFGPLSGRKTDFTVWLGSQDPDAQAFRAAQTVAADHMAGMFGARSPAVIQQLHDAIGQFKDNPAAALAGIAQVEKATKVFSKAGTPHTSTSAGASSGPTQLDKADSAKAAEQYNALPKGTQFITPDGKAGTKQ